MTLPSDQRRGKAPELLPRQQKPSESALVSNDYGMAGCIKKFSSDNQPRTKSESQF